MSPNLQNQSHEAPPSVPARAETPMELAQEITEFLDYANHEGAPEQEVERLLSDQRNALKKALREGPALDQGSAEALFPLAERFPEIAYELVCNSSLTEHQVNRLAEVAMLNMDQGAKWSLVVMELVAYPSHHALLSESSLSKIEANPMTKQYLEAWNEGGRAHSNVIRMPSGNKPKNKPKNRSDRKLAI